jgi:peptide/nickel transport system permease protein
MTTVDASIAVNDPTAAQSEQRVAVASQWQLMWWKFKRHKLALWSGVIVLLVYFIALFAEFLAPYDPDSFSARDTYAPPQAIHLWHRDAQGSLVFGLHANPNRVQVDRLSLQRTFVPDTTRQIPLGFFVKSEPYKMWGLFTLERKFFGPVEPGARIYVIGADRLGRDMLSRLIHGARISMSIGLVGVGVSLILGIILGGISGYFGGWIDDVIQRTIEFLRSIPQIPLWMGLAAAIPATLDPLMVYFLVTVILSLLGWTGLAREVRSRFMSLKGDDFVAAARLDGCSEIRIILRHMVPSFMSHIIATLTLAIPSMILAETALSFLGIGLRPPVVSWGVLLQEAQNIRSLATAPWLFAPGFAVVITVLALNFLGDGLRDAADPYES